MARRARTALLVAALAAMTAPNAATAAGCTSTLPVSDPRASVVTCTGIRVGMLLKVPSQRNGEMDCAASFAFTDQNKQRYVTFPGSCFLDYDCLEDVVTDLLPPPLDDVANGIPICLDPGDSELEPVYKRNGPVVRDQSGRRVGAIVYAVNKNGIDFALARIDSGLALDPSMPLYGGPRKIGAVGADPEEVRVYSAQIPGLPAPNARSGIMHTFYTGEPYIETDAFLSIAYGSSVMRPDGSAIGFFPGPWTVGVGYRTQRLAPAIDRAERRTKLNLTLMTAKLA